jgi:hypothetical protein
MRPMHVSGSAIIYRLSPSYPAITLTTDPPPYSSLYTRGAEFQAVLKSPAIGLCVLEDSSSTITAQTAGTRFGTIPDAILDSPLLPWAPRRILRRCRSRCIVVLHAKPVTSGRRSSTNSRPASVSASSHMILKLDRHVKLRTGRSHTFESIVILNKRLWATQP